MASQREAERKAQQIAREARLLEEAEARDKATDDAAAKRREALLQKQKMAAEDEDTQRAQTARSAAEHLWNRWEAIDDAKQSRAARKRAQEEARARAEQERKWEEERADAEWVRLASRGAASQMAAENGKFSQSIEEEMDGEEQHAFATAAVREEAEDVEDDKELAQERREAEAEEAKRTEEEKKEEHEAMLQEAQKALAPIARITEEETAAEARSRKEAAGQQAEKDFLAMKEAAASREKADEDASWENAMQKAQQGMESMAAATAKMMTQEESIEKDYSKSVPEPAPLQRLDRLSKALSLASDSPDVLGGTVTEWTREDAANNS